MLRESRRLLPLALLLSVVVVLWLPVPASRAAEQRVDLTVLVVTDGGSATQALLQVLGTEGVPSTVVDLRDAGRPVINDAFLSDVVDTGPRAKFQAVVLPNGNPFAAGSSELSALVRFEQQFGIRQVDAYSYASPAVGLNTPAYSGSLDGTTAQLTAAAFAGGFGYLQGPVSIDVGAGSYGHLGTPLPDEPSTGGHFEPYLTAPIPGTAVTGSLAGVYTHDRRSELVLTVGYYFTATYFRLLAHGLVTWMTKGVHLGYNRNYFTLHVDDLFLANYRWSTIGRCTPNSGDCPAGVPATTPVRMTPGDEAFAKSWQDAHGFTFDMMFNAYGHDQITGPDPLADALLADQASFRWVNHTYSHPFLGCVRDFSVIPWRCVTDPTTGAVQYTSQSDILLQIMRNVTWANDHALTIDPGELVTGEHGGLAALPQQPVDNPNLAPALEQAGIKWLASDNSRESAQRQLGPAQTVPRYPMDIFYNVGRQSEEVDEYNWIYTSRANGGSGACETSSKSTCIAPLAPDTGYTSYIVPTQVKMAFSHVLGNNPRPHYVHQANMAEDRIIYPVLDGLFGQYGAAFATNTPMVNLRMRDIATMLRRQNAWAGVLSSRSVSAYLIGGVVTVQAPTGTDVPLTMPTSTVLSSDPTRPAFGEAYAGEQSDYVTSDATPIQLTLPPY